MKRWFSSKLLDVLWGQIIVALTVFASIRTYTELMDSDAFGAAMLGIGTLAFLESLISMSLSQTQIALCAKVTASDERRNLSVGLSCLLVMALLPIALILSIVCAGLSIILPGALYAVVLIIAIFFYFSGEALKYSLTTLLVLDQKYRKQSAWIAVENVLAYGGIVLALITFGASPWTFIFTHILVRISNSIFFTLLLGGAPHFRGLRLSCASKHAREAIAHGLPVAAMGPLGWISSYLDRFIIGAILGTSATGAYVAATGLVGRPYALTTAVLSNYFRPHLFVSSGNEVQQTLITMKWLVSAAVIGSAGAIALLVSGPFIVQILLADAYRSGAIGLMTAYAIAQTLTIMTHALDNNLLASQRSKSLLKMQTVMSISTLAIIPIGTVTLGPLGAILARCVAEALKLGASYFLVTHIPLKTSEGVSTIIERKLQ